MTSGRRQFSREEKGFFGRRGNNRSFKISKTRGKNMNKKRNRVVDAHGSTVQILKSHLPEVEGVDMRAPTNSLELAAINEQRYACGSEAAGFRNKKRQFLNICKRLFVRLLNTFDNILRKPPRAGMRRIEWSCVSSNRQQRSNFDVVS